MLKYFTTLRFQMTPEVKASKFNTVHDIYSSADLTKITICSSNNVEMADLIISCPVQKKSVVEIFK